MTEFAYSIDIPVRLRDLDVMGHVNNAVYVTYFEQARVEYLQDVVGEAFETGGIVLANLEVDYLDTIDFDDPVTVAIRITDLGETSLQMEHRLHAAGAVAAIAQATVVAYDPDQERPRPLPEVWRKRIRAHEPGLDG